ncbi:nitrile hydratase subunit alpha [Tateyamaria pelophila]|uniref:nitrile hydratase subunit alpha n=1 Tax=Tateyamaria pelophila TaxID=328415 RepID=UPI001CBF8F68|nr:nitrile hydratase subunit alpha [Tateyamaria pelophila]
MSSPTDEDWLEIHKKAWTDPAFRENLESDPTATLRAYGESVGKTYTQFVKMPPAPNEDLEKYVGDEYKAPPACC